MPTLMYGVEACRLNKSDISSLDFVVNRFLVKMFKTNNITRTSLGHARSISGSDSPATWLLRVQRNNGIRRICTIIIIVLTLTLI